ncbi:MAG: hypothetical protein AB8G95_24470 [Anaerolineae bacterium]
MSVISASIGGFHVRNASSWTIFVFGLMAFILGVVGIIWPESTLFQLGFDIVDRADRAGFDYTIVFITASAMASFNIGIYYMLAAGYNLQRFFQWTVVFRCVTFVVFMLLIFRGQAPVKFMTVPIWELTGAVATGIALWVEQKNTA